MATANDIIKGAYRLLGVASNGETLSAAEAQDGLDALVDLIDSLSADGLPVPYVTRESFALTIGTDSYTYGSGGDFDSSRPIDILSAYIRDADDTDFSVDVVSRTYYNSIEDKGDSARPRALYFTDEYPLAKVIFDNAPDVSYTLYVDSIKPMSTPTGISSSMSFPPGFNRMLRYNLAIDLAAEHGIQLNATVPAIAQESRAIVERRGINPEIMSTEVGATGIYNIFTDS